MDGERFFLACAICEVRKEKRICPALGERICPICCGREREVSLDCPSHCEYLQQARRHEKPRRPQDLAGEELFREVEVRDRVLAERQPLVTGLLFGLARAARSDGGINDRDLIAALTALARSQQRLVSSGLHYNEQPTGPVQQAVARHLQQMVDEYRELERRHLGAESLRDSELLQAYVFLVRMAYSRTSGRPKSRAFLDFLATRFPERDAGVAGASQPGGSIILP